MTFLSAVEKGFVWIGKELKKAAEWVPKLIVLVDDVEKDTTTLLPELGIVIDDAGEVVKAAVKDSGADIAAAEALIAAITAAVAAKGLNIAQDEGVAKTFEAFIKQVANSSNYADLIAAVKALVLSYDTLGGIGQGGAGEVRSRRLTPAKGARQENFPCGQGWRVEKFLAAFMQLREGRIHHIRIGSHQVENDLKEGQVHGSVGGWLFFAGGSSRTAGAEKESLRF